MSLVVEALVELALAQSRTLRRHQLLLEMLTNATLRVVRVTADAWKPDAKMTGEFEAMLNAFQTELEADQSAELEAVLKKLTAAVEQAT